LYSETDRPSEAIEILEQGIEANPDSVILHIYLTSIYIEKKDYYQADILVKKAESLDPDSPLVTTYRTLIDLSLSLDRPKPIPTTPRLSKPGKQKKRRR